MLVTSAGKFVLVAVMLSLLGGCQYLGPSAIDQGRDRYNSIIQSTSKTQTLANIVRVYNHEPTSFMEVTEVDATQSVVGQVNGALTNIGATATRSTTAGTLAGQVGSVSGGAQYSETPTIRYQPLLGQALVAQMVTPISPEALGLLNDSYWNVAPLLDFAVSYLTYDVREFYAALNIIAELSADGALELIAAKSDVTKPQDSTRSTPIGKSQSGNVTLEVTNKSTATGANDALVIYFLPFHPHASRSSLVKERRELQLWVRLVRLYSGSQPKFTPPKSAKCREITRYNVDLVEARKCLPNSIELRTMPVMPAKAASEGLASGAPMMRTYSALGILKNATEKPHPKIAFVTPEIYQQIRSYQWNQDTDNSSFYTLLRESENPNDNPADKGQETQAAKIDQEVTQWLLDHPDGGFVYEPKSGDMFGDDYIKGNRRLGLLRRYILVIVDDHPPANAYVVHFDQGKWYYIAGDDEISQKNFNLISLFLTMMATPSALPPLSPVINVGG